MEQRRLGKTGHMSTVVAFGTYAIGVVDQSTADRTIEFALERGINHFDVAPSYADAELRLGDYLKRHPQPELFIGCKTQQRARAGASEELHRTLDRLGRDRFDLYQLHAVCTEGDLNDCFADGGSMEAILSARDEGIVSQIGITGHGWAAPSTHRAALDRFDFATVMTSANAFMASRPAFLADWQTLLDACQKRDVGVHLLKATAKASWDERDHAFTTWYEPLTASEEVDAAVGWALRQPVTTLCSAGDLHLLPAICDAAERCSTIPSGAESVLLANPTYGDIFAEATA